MAKELIEDNLKNENLVLLNRNLRAAKTIAFAKALKDNTSIEIIYLSNNKIGDKGAAALANVLEKIVLLLVFI